MRRAVRPDICPDSLWAVPRAEVNRVLVARYDCVDRRILPRPQALEAKLAFVIRERAGNVIGEELGRDLTDHGPSVSPRLA
jgi:hypothetical protein